MGQISIEKDPEGIELLNNPSVKLLRADPLIPFEEILEKNFTETYKPGDFPEKREAIWLKLEVITSNSDSLIYIYSREDYYTIFHQVQETWEISKNGFLTPLSQRSNKREKRFIGLSLNPNEITPIFIKLEAGGFEYSTHHPQIGGTAFYYKALNKEIEFNRLNIILSIVYLTGIIVVFIFILLQYVSLREDVYKYYLLFLLAQLFFGLVVLIKSPIRYMNFGLYYPKLFYYANESSQFLFIGVYALFIIHLFNFNKEYGIGRFMLRLAYFCFGYAVFSLIFMLTGPSIEMRYRMFDIIRFIIVPINIYLIIWIVWKVKEPLVNYFIIAHLFFFAGTAISVVAQIVGLDKDPSSIFYFENSLNVIFQMGLLGEVVCFSLALALRIKILQEEREESTLAYINQLKENELIKERMNRELDIKVRETTEELKAIHTEMERQREREITLEFSRKIQEMEMLTLRNQMNPHFLFNSMNAIKHMILTHRFDEGINYLDDFSGLLRKVLQSSKRQTITVEEELEILELYLSLEKARMGEELEVVIDIDNRELLSQYLIPGLLLQPFVENAIWHGLLPSKKKTKTLNIKFETEPNLKISIEDNGVGRQASQVKKEEVISMHQSMGMKIAENRLKLFNQTHNFNIIFDIIDLKSNSGKADGTLVKLNYTI